MKLRGVHIRSVMKMESTSMKLYSEEGSLRMSKGSLFRDSIIISIKTELALTPKDLHLHECLLKRYLSIKEVEKAFDHAFNVEFRDKIFNNDLNWYEMLNEILICDSHEKIGWLFQLFLLTITERICSINLLTKFKMKSLIFTECTRFLYAYYEAIHKAVNLGPSLENEMFHTDLLRHHKGQIALHSATLLLIKSGLTAKPGYEVASLMFTAWQTVPSNLKRNWLKHASETQILAVNCWYTEGTYRCSQAGHYCLYFIKTFSLETFLFYIDMNFNFHTWLFADIETEIYICDIIGRNSKILPSQSGVQAYDKDAQKEYPHSLHHIVWILLKYEKMADFECILFNTLNFSTMDSKYKLNKLDIYAFLYCATLTARNNGYDVSTLPANITSMLCSYDQTKWWECAYEYYTNQTGSDLISINATFNHGIKVIRCMGKNKLDPELLCNLGCIFSERAEKSRDIKETYQLKERAVLYYQTAMMFLQKLINTSVDNVTQHRDITLFKYVCKDMDDIKVKHLLKECRIGLVKNSLSYGEYQAFYNLAQAYKINALIFSDLKLKDKMTTSLFEAKIFASKALNKLLEQKNNLNNLFYSEIQELIQEIEMDYNSFEINSTELINSKHLEKKSFQVTNSNLSWCEENCKLIKTSNTSHFNLLESAINQVSDKIDRLKNVAEDIQYLRRRIRRTELELRISQVPFEHLGQSFLRPSGLRTRSTTSTMPSTSVGTPSITPDTAQYSFSVNLKNFVKFSTHKNQIAVFKFGSTPTLKPVLHEVSDVKKPPEVTNTVNVFSGYSNIFNIKPAINTSTSTNISTPNNIPQNSATNTLESHKLNSSECSDTVAEFEPNVYFEPVIPLPPLIDHKTGEEDETVLFEHRAKLLKFDTVSKEWKERGLGNIKLLVHKDNIQKVRLLMRREQIMKVCCNHTITKNMTFQKMPNNNKVVTWCAKDFSEGELIPETLCLRFKTALLCDQFIESIKAAQTKTIDESKSTKEEQNTAKQIAQTGFSDKIKPKSGWYCNTCYTHNLVNFNKCTCCEMPEPKSNTDVRTITSAPTNVSITVGWKEKFQRKAGSWYCHSCLVCNEETLMSCTACNSPKDRTKVNTSTTSMKQLDNTTKFNIGIPPSTATSTVEAKSIVVNERDLFKPNSVELNMVNKTVQGRSFDTVYAKPTKLTKDDIDDVIFVQEIQATQEEKQKAAELMLPDHFYTYKNKEPCQGCRGCQDDDSKSTSSESETLTIIQTTELHSISETKFSSVNGTLNAPLTLTINASTPLKGNNTETTNDIASNSEKSKEASSVNNREEENAEKAESIVFSVENSPACTAMSSISDSGFHQSKDFKWEAVGEQLFIGKKQTALDGDRDNDSGTGDDEVTGGNEENAQNASIEPLPDRIVVTTGEEDETSTAAT